MEPARRARGRFRSNANVNRGLHNGTRDNLSAQPLPIHFGEHWTVMPGRSC